MFFIFLLKRFDAVYSITFSSGHLFFSSWQALAKSVNELREYLPLAGPLSSFLCSRFMLGWLVPCLHAIFLLKQALQETEGTILKDKVESLLIYWKPLSKFNHHNISMSKCLLSARSHTGSFNHVKSYVSLKFLCWNLRPRICECVGTWGWHSKAALVLVFNRLSHKRVESTEGAPWKGSGENKVSTVPWEELTINQPHWWFQRVLWASKNVRKPIFIAFQTDCGT